MNANIWLFLISIILRLGYTFRCHECRCRKSIRTGSFFEHSHLSLDTIFELMYCWSLEMNTIETLMRQIDIGSTRSIVDWRNFCRDVCAEYYIRHPLQIGDILHQFIKNYTFIYLQDRGMWLKLTKSCFGMPKYERGRLHQTQQWLFRGVDIQTRKCFMMEVRAGPNVGCWGCDNLPIFLKQPQLYLIISAKMSFHLQLS